MKHTAQFSLACFVTLSVWGCKTGAIGVEACRKIETARCEAASGCELVGSLSECERFAHDNCLHGFGAETDPRPSDVDNCVEALHAASECVAAHGNIPPSRCKDDRLTDSRAATVCDFAISPELTPQCEFLVEPPAEPATKSKGKAVEPEPEASAEDAGTKSIADAASE